MAELPESVDRDILEGRTILAVKTIREVRGCSLREAVDLYHQRYGELHAEPDPAERSPSRETPRPRVLRLEPDGSLAVFEEPHDG
ncbi:hypothetical protein ADK65_13985 [Streptomyces sp. NRRL B-1140]|uniref:hypothetical protein n=1 Tax=Streptomyces sp. NRRL B-1140 TaxID=1415549 RepID=UPI0006AE329B|nr:hypothetical protein [Streptomyces sp. NRRL B-1140]KOX00732.1 hypothetical protein ADK65_13985 [Streptomyces sp. NRRL B-1140]